MLQRRMNNWTTVSDRGIKCLERLSCVHTSGIGAFYTFGDIFRRTSDRPLGIRWCWYPAEMINENRRRVLTKLFDGFCFRSLIYNKRCASAYSGQCPDLYSVCSLFCACWWRSHDVLFSVNSVHRLNCNVLLTAQWCAWMKKIMNYKFDGSSVFFISDTHFNHTNIIRFCNRPFKDVSHMNETIISNWNRVVGPEDIIFHLDDFCLDGSAEWVNVLNRLNGNIVA